MKLIFTFAVAASAILLLVLPTETQGAPSQRGPGIASEEVGKVVEELRGLLAKSMAADSAVQDAGNHRETMTIAQRFPNSQHRAIAQRFPNSQHRAIAQRFPSSQHRAIAQQSTHPRLAAQGKLQQSSEVTAQVAGFTIENCGEEYNVEEYLGSLQSDFRVLNFFFGNQFGVLINCGISPNCVQVQVDVPAGNVLADIDICQVPNSKYFNTISCITYYLYSFRFVWSNMCADLRGT